MAASAEQILDDPESYSEGMKSSKAAAWQGMMQEEYQSLIKIGTWKLVPLPAGRKAIRCKWIYKIKTYSDGTIAWYKARLVAQDCTQTRGVDYDQTFSLVVKYDSIQTVLAIAAQQQMLIMQFDIQTAFLHGVIDTIICMLQPPGFEVTSKGGQPLICLILNNLYRLKQSGRIWNQIFERYFLKFELEPTDANQCIYIFRNDPALIVSLFVDNGLACCSSNSKLATLISYMEQHFVIT